ncbi:hypothetical protein IAT38_007218 [Cryptococcus sp. DSM 104549]
MRPTATTTALLSLLLSSQLISAHTPDTHHQRRSRHARHAKRDAASLVDLAERIGEGVTGESKPSPGIGNALVAVEDDGTTEASSGEGHWSVYQASTWIPDPTTTAGASVAIETVWVTETVWEEGDPASLTAVESVVSTTETTESAAAETTDAGIVALAASDLTTTADSATATATVTSAGETSVASATDVATTDVATDDTATGVTTDVTATDVATVTDAVTTAVSATASDASASATDASATVTDASSAVTTGAAQELIAEADSAGISVSLGVGITIGGGGSPTSTSAVTVPPATTGPVTSTSKFVAAHFMIGIVSTYQPSDWIADINLAKSKGIDGFALNIGVDWYSQDQLDMAYAAAEGMDDFKLFISFDFNWYTITNTTGVANMLKRYVGSSAQLRVDGKPFVSTFIGDGFDWSETAAQVGEELYAVPFYQPSAETANDAGVSGLFSWAAWPGQLDNVPVDESMNTDRDLTYLGFTEAANKIYMAPVSSWFSTHFGKEVSYSKNWVFKGETLWKDRWDEILSLGSRLNFLEIITWNDYGESHHIGPYDTPHTDDSSSIWAAGLDHSAMLDFAVPYIKAFKAGASAPVIDEEMLVYWYRPHLKSAECDSTDTCGGKPTGWDFLEDTVFVTAFTKAGGIVKITSGSNLPVIKKVDKGAQMFEVPMGVGEQKFEFVTFSGGFRSAASNVTVSADCWNGNYNFNYHSGSVVC